MKPEFFSHSKECIELNDNCLMEYCICSNCKCHICLFNNDKEYRQNYIQKYFEDNILSKHNEVKK